MAELKARSKIDTLLCKCTDGMYISLCQSCFGYLPLNRNLLTIVVKPEEYNQWLGAGWKDEEVLSSDNPQFLRLHKKLVDLKREMQKLNGEVGGRLMFVSFTKTTGLSTYIFQRDCTQSA